MTKALLMTLEDARLAALLVLEEHGLNEWRFAFDNAKRRAGSCRYGPKIVTLSKHYVLHNSDADVFDTIRHEVAHAIAGPRTGHGVMWMAACVVTGARQERCYGDHVDMPKGKWHATCPGCGHEFHWHRRPRRSRYCVRCGREKGRLSIVLSPDAL